MCRKKGEGAVARVFDQPRAEVISMRSPASITTGGIDFEDSQREFSHLDMGWRILLELDSAEKRNHRSLFSDCAEHRSRHSRGCGPGVFRYFIVGKVA